MVNEAIATLPICVIPIIGFLDSFNHQFAASDDKYNMFHDDEKHREIKQRKIEIEDVESRLKKYLNTARQDSTLAYLDYVTIAGVEYLLEVKSKDVKKVPPNWIKVAGTKAFARFHSPQIISMVAERERYKELLAIECDNAYTKLLKEISSHYDSLRNTVRSLAVLDCIISLSVLAALPGYVRPSFVNQQIIDVVDARHPIIEQFSTSRYVPNGINLQQQEKTGSHHNGSKYGRKELLCSPSCSNNTDGSNWVLCSV